MTLRLEGVTAEDVGAAKRSLEAMALSWGQEIAEALAEATTMCISRRLESERTP